MHLQDILANQEKDIGRLQRNLKFTQSELEEERRLREAAESQVRMMSVELRRTEEEMKKTKKDTHGDDSLKIKNEKLGAENFEYAVENVSFIKSHIVLNLCYYSKHVQYY